MTRDRWRIVVNPSRLSSLWWEDAKARYDAPEKIETLLSPIAPREIYVTPEDGAAILHWAAALPGWDAADPPLIFETEDVQ